MSRSLQRFPWWLVVSSIAACYLLADLFVFKGPLHTRIMQGRGQGGGVAAEVFGLPITRLDLEEAMREQLWKRNKAWASLSPEERKQTRWLALENLVNDRILRASRSASGPDTGGSKAAAKREAEIMQRQFADAAEFPRRLAAQRLTPQSLQARIYDAQLDEAWIAEKIQPRLKEMTQQDLRAWYDQFKETLRIPQAHHAAHIFLTRHDQTKPDRLAEIREIQRQLLAKEKTFAQLAKEHSEDARSKSLGGDLGWFTPERMPADFIAAVQNLKIGHFSEPVQTQLGWHLIIVLERHASRLPALAEAKVEITALLTSKQRAEAVKSLIAELRENSPQSVLYHAEVIDHAEPAP
ncbi:MAG: peptidylprolyl isomerase [Prosthecobacter sp.]|uniref:peptidylprolyl isomerase n=1 Tax=Prosthecobacter sp. TaxID=1965333 RepID=UPI002615AD0B|nr:peptidylprolyl isomerase [Prosthecobacter sp.]MCF7789190.1 peptidylprolyl isomerase [Prosthecobacter sp.]